MRTLKKSLLIDAIKKDNHQLIQGHLEAIQKDRALASPLDALEVVHKNNGIYIYRSVLEEGALETLKFLMNHGISHPQSKWGQTGKFWESSVRVCIQKKQYKTLQYLLGLGADLKNISIHQCPAIFEVLEKDDTTALKILLDHGVSPNESYGDESRFRTLLGEAIVKKSVECAELLIKAGVDVEKSRAIKTNCTARLF